MSLCLDNFYHEQRTAGMMYILEEYKIVHFGYYAQQKTWTKKKKKKSRISIYMLTIPCKSCSKSVLARKSPLLALNAADTPSLSCQCFCFGITEMPTISLSANRPLPVTLPFFSSSVLFHTFFSQLSIFLRSLR